MEQMPHREAFENLDKERQDLLNKAHEEALVDNVLINEAESRLEVLKGQPPRNLMKEAADIDAIRSEIVAMEVYPTGEALPHISPEKEFAKNLEVKDEWVINLERELGREVTIETIEGGRSTAAEYESAIADAGMTVTDYAKDLLNGPDFIPAQEGQTLRLVNLSIADIRPRFANIEFVYARAKELGLELCPAWVGPAKLLKDKSTEPLVIAMEPVAGSDTFKNFGNLFVLGVTTEGEPALHAHAVDGSTLDSQVRFVFCRRE